MSSYTATLLNYEILITFYSERVVVVLQEFLISVSNDAKAIPALRDQLTELERIVKRK